MQCVSATQRRACKLLQVPASERNANDSYVFDVLVICSVTNGYEYMVSCLPMGDSV